MAHRWKSTNKGVLKFGNGLAKKVIMPGDEIPEDLIQNVELKLLKRFGSQIEEFERERIIKKQSAAKVEVKNGDKK